MSFILKKKIDILVLKYYYNVSNSSYYCFGLMEK